MTKVVVKQSPDPTKNVPIEVLAQSIQAMAEGIRKLRAGPLNDRALFLLIQHAAPNAGGRYNTKSLSIKEISAVFAGIDSLEREYLKPKKAKAA